MADHAAPLRLALLRNPPPPQAEEERWFHSSPACGRGVNDLR